MHTVGAQGSRKSMGFGVPFSSIPYRATRYLDVPECARCGGSKDSISALEVLTIPDKETSNRRDKAGGKCHHQGRRLA